MTIDEAIKILELGCSSNEWAEYRRTIEATRLGIEALKWISQWRGVNSALSNVRLLGEMEEKKGKR